MPWRGIDIGQLARASLSWTHLPEGSSLRDLKPENILLHEGQPLVADFGISLALSVAGGERITRTGMSLGTRQYMSPEQATGDRVIDPRSDVYSLGAVTYEMLTGDVPHTGSSAQAIIARVLTEQPRTIRATRPTVSSHVEATVMRALEKIPADRWQTAQDFANALSAGRQASLPASIRTGPVSRFARFSPQRVAIVLLALVAGAALVTWLGRRFSHDSASSLSFVIERPIANGVRQAIDDFALSPDGETVALVARSDSGSQVFLRRLSDPNASVVPGTEGASFVAFSPNGQWLGVTTSQGRLLKVRVDGSVAPITLADGIDWYSGIAWADDETIVLGSARPDRHGLGRISAGGGTIFLVDRMSEQCPRASDSARHFRPCLAGEERRGNGFRSVTPGCPPRYQRAPSSGSVSVSRTSAMEPVCHRDRARNPPL